MKKTYLTMAIISLFSPYVPAQIFSQDFESSVTLSDYVSSNPDSHQFNSISTTGSGTTVSINNGHLNFTRTGNNTGSFSRTTDFSPEPRLLRFSFDLSVSANTTAQTSAAVIQSGSNFSSNNTSETNANIHSRLGINIQASSGNFSLRDINGSANSPVFSGTQNIVWFINNSGMSKNYLAPDESNESIADDKFDVWIGTTKVLDERNATTASQILSDLKFVFNNGTASIEFDNLRIDDLTDPLPIHLISFNARLIKNCIELYWETSDDSNEHLFEVEKISPNKDSKLLLRLETSKTDFLNHHYSVTDSYPDPGNNYYRLKMTDLNGIVSYSPVISQKLSPAGFSIKSIEYRQEEASLKISLFLCPEKKYRLEIYAINGRKIFSKNLCKKMDESYEILLEKEFQQGIYILSLFSEDEIQTKKFIIP